MRLIVQRVPTTAGNSWRLIAYGDGDRHCAPEFDNLKALLALLQHSVPDLDLSNIAAPADASEASVVYAADVRLTEAQQIALGLIAVSSGKAR